MLTPKPFKTAIMVLIGLLLLYLSAKIIAHSATSSETALQRSSTDKLYTNYAQEHSELACTDKACKGYYHGPEFIDSSDIAHQFSNSMSNAVGHKLKTLYKQGNYSKVDFSNINMTTKGMGSGTVTYTLSIPFTAVTDPCDAYTSFDHVGGWNHTPALHRRKQELSSVLLKGQSLAISALKTTPEGLQEYWIQWKNKVLQADCK